MNRKARFALFFAVMGPGIITAFADNDAGGIATYASIQCFSHCSRNLCAYRRGDRPRAL